MRHSTNRSYLITNQKVLTPMEQTCLVRVCTKTLGLEVEGRNGVMLLTILETGVRATELLNIRIKDFNPDTDTVFIRSLKGSNARELPLRHSRSRTIKRVVMKQYGVDEWRDLDPEERLFPIGYPRLFQIWEFYRPTESKTLHSLRHTFAINLYDRTRDIKAVQMALGHRQIQNTMVYLDFWYSQNKLRELMHG